MKISELIGTLELIKGSHGDLVCYGNNEFGGDIGEIEEFSSCQDGAGLCIAPKRNKPVLGYVLEEGKYPVCSVCGVGMEDKGNRYQCTNRDCKVNWVAK